VTKEFGNTLKDCLTSETPTSSASFEALKEAFGKVEKADNDTKKLLMDQGFRDCLTNGYLNVGGGGHRLELSKCRYLVELSISAARSELCSVSLPISIMADIFDVLYLDDALTFFSSVEDNVVVWKEPLFFAAIKNNLLRICNDLLRRLSRTQDTVFCGRILLFLAKFFPFSERSGLNIISEFNVDNVTLYTTSGSQDTVKDENGSGENEMEVDGEAKSDVKKDAEDMNIDYALYSKFWKLQDYFRNPVQCYEKSKWAAFAKYSKEVLDTFKSFKIDSVPAAVEDRKRKRRSKDGSTAMETAADNNGIDDSIGGKVEDYFAKYLTNQNLLQLQLSDANFRRYILVQFLILFQYLKSTVKFKTDSQVLSDDHSRWVETSTKLVYELIEETPTNGKAFAKSVKHILEREEQWNRWKNEGCPSLKPKDKPAAAADEQEKEKQQPPPKLLVAKGSIRKRKKKLGDQIKEARAANKFLMGNANLTKLWNLCPNNLEAAAAPERAFLPSMDEWLEEAAEQLDPAQQVEETYRKVNDGQWGWRALRLLAKKSNFFYTYGHNKPIGTVPEYLTERLKEHYPQRVSSGGGGKTNAAASAAAASAAASTDTEDDESGDQADASTEGGASATTLCTQEHLAKLAEKMADKWKKLIPKLGQTSTDMALYQKEETEDSKRALLMLRKWAKDEGEGATKEEIQYILEGLKMDSILEGIF